MHNREFTKIKSLKNQDSTVSSVSIFSSNTDEGNIAKMLVLLCDNVVPNLILRAFIPLDQQSGSKRPWKVLIGSPKISDFLKGEKTLRELYALLKDRT